MIQPSQPIGYLLARAHHRLRLKLDSALVGLDITAPQYAVMEAMSREPGITGAELARKAAVTAQTMGGLVQALERASYVERSPCVNNARRIANRLTPQGIAVLRKARADVRRIERNLTAGLDRDVLSTLTAALVQLSERLGDRET